MRLIPRREGGEEKKSPPPTRPFYTHTQSQPVLPLCSFSFSLIRPPLRSPHCNYGVLPSLWCREPQYKNPPQKKSESSENDVCEIRFCIEIGSTVVDRSVPYGPSCRAAECACVKRNRRGSGSSKSSSSPFRSLLPLVTWPPSKEESGLPPQSARFASQRERRERIQREGRKVIDSLSLSVTVSCSR